MRQLPVYLSEIKIISEFDDCPKWFTRKNNGEFNQLKLPHLTSIFQVPLSILKTHLLQSYVLLLCSPISIKYLLEILIISIKIYKFFTFQMSVVTKRPLNLRKQLLLRVKTGPHSIREVSILTQRYWIRLNLTWY